METIGAEETITHVGVDACPAGQARHHFRSILVDAGVLPARDEQTERLDTWVDEYLAELPKNHAAVIAPYARWSELRAVRRRAMRRRTSIGVAGSARVRIRAAGRLLCHLEEQGNDIESLSQDSLDRWLGGNASRSGNIAPFVAWLNRRSDLLELRVSSAKTPEPSEVSEEDDHHVLIRELVSGGGGDVDLMTRVAGLLILLYGARAERIHRLTTADITKTGERTFLTLATQPIELPFAVAQLLDELVVDAERTPGSTLRNSMDRYLFASPKRPHEPVHPLTLGRWLARAGVSPHLARNHAMLALATDLPAAVVATQMGLTAQTTNRWARLSQRDNAHYLIARSAANISNYSEQSSGTPESKAVGVGTEISR